MKKLFTLLALTMLIFLPGCVQEERLPIEGAWMWLSADYSLDKTESPVQDDAEITKFWTGGHFAFIGQLRSGSTIEDRYGWGTYELDGNRYTEHVKFHYDPVYQGSSVRMILEIRNDTLIQKWPVDENWMLPEVFNSEKYIRR
jgi:hypothetical protein